LARVTLAKRQEFLAGAPLFADLKKGQLGPRIALRILEVLARRLQTTTAQLD
jgi:hypothetical protein